jgi:AcrR family transcriptional regulator
MATRSDTPLRADAQRNRAKLLAAAGELFAEAGPEAPLEAIARRAEVGIGTLYRHFPTRDALIEAVYRREVDNLVEAAGELLASRPPDRALAEWMDRFVAYAATKRGLGAALKSAAAGRSGLFAETRGRLVGAIAALLEAGAAAGTIRDDVDADDVLRAMGAVWSVPDDADWPAQPRRLIRIVMDGLRYGTRNSSP